MEGGKERGGACEKEEEDKEEKEGEEDKGGQGRFLLLSGETSRAPEEAFMCVCVCV